MTLDTANGLDEMDWRILVELQQDGRLPWSELGRRVHLSAPAVADRVRRLEDAGVIAGYRAVVDHTKVGFPLLAYVRVRYANGDAAPFHKAIRSSPEVLECHHVTGEDCYVLKVVARSMPDLERVTGALARLGGVTTSLVFSTVLDGRVLTGPSGR
jgi:Lrp/AsnC family transcriptional regulator, leucine-responsive regulatory protein